MIDFSNKKAGALSRNAFQTHLGLADTMAVSIVKRFSPRGSV